MNYYIECWKKYVTFEGRARRKEYWMFVLFNFLASLAIGIVGRIIGLPALSYLYSLAVFLPSLAVAVRRLHDTNRSGWWILISLIPLAGPIWFFALTVFDSTPGENCFGPNPKWI